MTREQIEAAAKAIVAHYAVTCEDEWCISEAFARDLATAALTAAAACEPVSRSQAMREELKEMKRVVTYAAACNPDGEGPVLRNIVKVARAALTQSAGKDEAKET